MNRLLILALATTAIGIGNLAHEYVANPPVDLQPSSPGVAQVGNVNVTGTVLAGTFYGSSGGDTTKVVSGWATSPTGYVFGGDFRTNSVDGRGIFASALSTSGFNYGGDFRSASINGRGIFGYATAVSGPNIGGEFRTLSTAGRGVVGSALAATGTGIGVFGEAPSPNGYAGYFDGRLNVTGNALVGGGLTATTLAGNGAGVTGVNADLLNGLDSNAFLQHVPVPLVLSGGEYPSVFSASNVDQITGTSAVYGYSSSSINETYGVYGRSDSVVGIAVFGVEANTTGVNYGGYFKTVSNAGTGVMGMAAASTGTTNGVFGQSKGTTGRGVSGYASSTTGINFGGRFQSDSDSGYGIYARTVANSGTNYGVYGTQNPQASGYALYAAGDSGASGIKSFRIDHPLDPLHKYLLHYSTESPVPQNFYSGNITTDAQGYAWVDLPSYFKEINANFKYQLTVLSEDFVQAVVSKKISGNRFQVRTSAPRTEVSWRVEADRNDRWVQYRNPRVEVEKDGSERGTYQHPELYGAPPEMGVNYEPSDGNTHNPPLSASAHRK